MAAVSAREFGLETLRTWVEEGYANEREAKRYRPLLAGYNPPNRDVSPYYCCYPPTCFNCSGDRGNKEGLAILGVIALALAFFASLAWTFKSAREAIDYGEQAQDAQENSRGDATGIFQQAKVVLQGMREERIAATFCRVILTAGFGLLTAAIAVAYLSNSRSLLNSVLFAGAAATGGGAIAYGIKEISFRHRQEKKALEEICRNLSGGSFTLADAGEA